MFLIHNQTFPAGKAERKLGMQWVFSGVSGNYFPPTTFSLASTPKDHNNSPHA